MLTQPAIMGLATAVPPYQYEQMELYERFMAHIYNNRRAPAIFRASEIDTRYSVIEDPMWLTPNPSAKERNDLYVENAPRLAIQVVEDLLDQTGLDVTDIDDLIVVSCTGLDTPSLDVLIADQMKMSPTLRRTAIVGMGCHGLLPGLHRASTAVQVKPETKAVVVTLELCTLHLQHDPNIRNILGSALFGDGASAVLVGNSETKATPNLPTIIDSLSFTDYDTRDEIAFHPGDFGYKIHLSTRIPKLLRLTLPDLLEQFLHKNKIQLTDIKHWIIHPGGAKILDYIEQALEMDQDEMRHARAILREYGNMSSATLLFVLERHLQEESPAPGDYGVMIGFGPGLTIELCLMQW
ncbi:MAG: type III polyketide synthase [Chloroflexota bacterium]